MFTGIIEATGKLVSLRRSGGAARAEISAPWDDLEPGESVAVNGVCLTVGAVGGKRFQSDISRETLERSTLGWLKAGATVNLERALRLGERLGGHLVYGHVDGTGRVARIVKRAEHWDIEISMDRSLGKYVADKGSVAVDGISLTVARKLPGGFALAVVPHTLRATAIGGWRAGDRVNLEVDMVAKYLESLNGKR